MPKRKFYRAKRRRPFKRRRRRYRRSTIYRNRGLSGLLGRKFKMSLRYVERNAINPAAAGVMTYQTYSANSLYDPDVTGVGHQPLGFDQIMAFYNHYTVLCCKMKVTFMPRFTTSADQVHVGILVHAGTSPGATDLGQVIENKRGVVYRTMGTMTSNEPVIVKKKVVISKYLDQKVMQEDSNAGSSTGSPIEQVYISPWAAAVSAGDDPSGVNILVQIDYLAVFHERKMAVGS